MEAAIHNIHCDFSDLGYEQKTMKHVTLYEKVGGIYNSGVKSKEIRSYRKIL